MNDFFELFTKKNKKQETKLNIEKTPDVAIEKNNYSILMPVGEYSNERLNLSKPEITNNSKNKIANAQKRNEYNPYSFERMESNEQLIELKRLVVAKDDELEILKNKITKLQNENSELAVGQSRYEYISSTYRIMIEKMIKILPYYKDIEFTGIGTPEEWDDRNLVEMFIKCIEDIKTKLNEKEKEISLIKSNPKLNLDIQTDNSHKPSNQGNIEIPESLSAIFPEQTDNDLDIDIEIPNDLEETTYIPDEHLETQNKYDLTILNRYKDRLGDDTQSHTVLEIIGQTGLARVSDLKEISLFKNAFLNGSGDFNQGMLSKKLQRLEELEMLNVETINTGRKGGNENLYELTPLGAAMYKHLFGTCAVESEKISIKKQHTSLEHGYFIKTVAKELESKGYEVLTKHEDCIRKTLMSNQAGDEKLRVEADLIIRKSGEEYLIECEMGTTSDADMTKKLDKLILTTKTISFIMNNKDSLNATSTKVDKWISKKGSENLKGYTFRFTTIELLKNREIWQTKGPF